MASRKITQLTELTAPASADVLPIVDVSEASPENQNKKITYAELLSSAPAGTAAAPAFAFDGDPNSGVYSVGADQVAISTGGTGRLFVDANGRVGVGTSSLSRTFNVAGSAVFNDGTVQTTVWPQLTTGVGGFGTNNNYPIALATNGSERLRITSAGLVGIGTSAPGQALDVVGTIQSTASTATGFNRVFDTDGITTGRAQLRLRNSGGGLQLGIEDSTGGNTLSGSAANSAYVGSNSNTPFYLTQNATIRATIDTSGRLGIGTTTVNRQLVLNDNGLACLALQNATTGNAATDGFQIQLSGTDAYVWNYENAPTIFGTNNTERARIDSSGRLLVGAATSADVGGASAIAQFTSTAVAPHTLSLVRANTPILAMANSGSVSNGSGLGAILFCGNDGTDLNSLGARIVAEVDGTPGADDMPGRLVFSTTADGAASPTERLRITSAGRVGIGTTSPAHKLQISGGDVVVDAGYGFCFGNNQNGFFGNGTSQFLNFYTGNAERARIDSSGRLLVGTATNTGGSLFQVNDNRIRIATAKTPASATDTGSAGEICWDADYIYVCTATNTWKRTAIATW